MLAVLSFNTSINAQIPGSIDTTFNTTSIYGLAPGANNTILTSLLQSDGKAIIAGSFTLYNGEPTNYIARLNTNGVKDITFNTGTGANNSIYSTALQSDGKLIIGGIFTSFNGTAINRIARINPDGSLDASFTTGSGADGDIQSISLQSDGKIIICGAFTTYNGTLINRIARLNSDGSLDLTFSVGAGANGLVRASKIQSDGKIVVSGDFTSYNGVLINRIARLNTNGSLDATFIVGTGFDNSVNTIALQNDGKIIVGGSFSTYNGATCTRFARLNINGSLDSGGIGNGFAGSGTIFTTVIQADGKIIIGGSFSTFNSVLVNRIARLNTDCSIDATFIGDAGNGNVNTSVLQGDGKLLIGGSFTFVNGTFTINRIARLNIDGTSDTNYNGFAGTNDNVLVTTKQSDGKILAGGLSTTFNGAVSNRIMRLNTDGSLDNSFNASPNDDIRAISIQNDGKIIAGGFFTSISGVAKNRIVRLNSDGSVDGSFITNIGTGTNVYVSTISIQPDGKIVVGGFFTTCNAVLRNNILRLNADGTLDNTFTVGSGANSVVLATALQSDGGIIIGGSFTSYNGITSNRIARLNADGSYDASFNVGSGANSTIKAISILSDGKIIICGDFTSYNGVSCNRIARLNSDGSIDPTFLIGTGANSSCNTTVIQPNGKIIVGGNFTVFNGATYNRIVRLNMDGSIDPTFIIGAGSNGDINSMVIQSDGKIIIGGVFYSYDGIAKARIARLIGDCTTPSAPIAQSSQSFCDIATVSDLSATGSGIQWYSASNGGSPLPLTTVLVDGVSYFASQTISICESDMRFEVVVTINNSSAGTDVQVACDSYTWIDGNTYTTSNNSATYTLINSEGCDSLITLNLTINHFSTGTDVQSACDSYIWIDGNTYTSSNNSATFTLNNAVGCDSVVTLNLTITETPMASILLNGATLTASVDGMIYQWIDCNNGNAEIVGENNQNFIPVSNGNYAVILTNGDCSSTSSCVSVTLVSIDDHSFINGVIIYPNPTNDVLNISGGIIERVEVYDLTGRMLLSSPYNVIDVSDLSSGVYQVIVNGNQQFRFVKD